MLENTVEEIIEDQAAEEPDTTEETTEEPQDDQVESFPRHVVEKLRKESAGYRERANTAEERAEGLGKRLHTALVAADGRLADPEDLEFNEEHLTDAEALKAAITDLVTRKPGLRSRRVAGDIGQGKRGAPKAEPVDLINIINGL